MPKKNKQQLRIASGKPHILVVEDYPPALMIVSAFLDQLGYEYDVAVDGREAIEKYTNSEYAVILMDLQLPHTDGMDVSRRIRMIEKEKARATLPIIAMTGRATKDDKLLCKRAGINELLSKPFRIAELESVLKRLIR